MISRAIALSVAALADALSVFLMAEYLLMVGTH